MNTEYTEEMKAKRAEKVANRPAHMVLGLDGKYHPRRPLTTSQMIARDKKIMKLRDQGMSVRAIAAELGCSVGTVHRVIQAEES
jgi:DNA-binding NarL/FixJ family response regulator